jgi:hypothetical protein
MVVKQGISASLVIVFAVLWLLWLPVVVVVALVQKRTIGLAILIGMLLGPFGFYFFPRLPPRKPRLAEPLLSGRRLRSTRPNASGYEHTRWPSAEQP